MRLKWQSQRSLFKTTPDKSWKLRFWAIFGGQAISLIGSALTQFVLMWWITDSTGTVAALATAAIAALLPQALMGPLGGVLADRYDRRLLMIMSDLISSCGLVVLIILFLTERVELWHIYAVLAVRSAMQAFQFPASIASVTMLVPEAFLTRAAGLNQAVQSVTVVAAAPLGALALGSMPLSWALAIDVITTILGIAPLLFFRIPEASTPSHGKGGLSRELMEGLSMVWNTPGLRQLYFLLGLIVLMVMPGLSLVPLLVKSHFDGTASHVALMEGVSGLGMLLGGTIVAVIAPRRQLPWILWGFAASCLTAALTGLVPRNLFSVAVMCWTFSGTMFAVGNAPLIALIQTIVPSYQQGRAFSLLNSVMGFAAPVGLALCTPLGEVIGVRALFIVTGILGTIMSLAGFTSLALSSVENASRSRRGFKKAAFLPDSDP